ncbi:MAG: S41 family peptidase [Solirubrobacteraceae bacterium]
MSSHPARSTRIVAGVAATLLVLLVGMWLGGHASWLPSPLRAAALGDANARLTHDVLGMLGRDYYRPLDTGRLLNDGLAAAVASLKDPYSHYLNPADYRGFQDQSNPHLSGIGVDVLPDPRGLRIVEVVAGSPAARSGLRGGELIVEVGATSLANRSEGFGSGLIRGRAGTRVTLTVGGGGKPRRTVSITRASITSPVASGSVVTFHGLRIGDLRLTNFEATGAGDELRSEVEKVLRGGARALILDLRMNPGGRIDEAVNVASIFIPDGTIVSTAGRSQPRQVYIAKGGAISTSIPLVVLVDQGSASAAEIVTAALQDRHRAKVVGTRTYGKGVFQEVLPLSNGGALDITVGEYFTPSGRNLGGGGVKQGAGVRPDMYAVDNPHTRVDEALAAAERAVAAQVR